MLGKRRHGRQIIAVMLVLVIAGCYIAYTAHRPLAALSPRSAYSVLLPAKTVTITWPAYGEAAVGARGYGVLETTSAAAPMPTASVIKILTALTILQAKPLGIHDQGPTLTMTQADVDSYTKYVAEDGSVVRVAVGEQLSERQALEALLLPSANNMAETLSRWSYGSIDTTLNAMEATAHELGMDDTTVTDPSGFLPATTSTPHDLVLLGEAALANPALAAIVSEPTATIPVQGTIYNVNRLLGQDGINGIKTGNNDADNGCYLFSANQTVGPHRITVVGVIMGGPNLSAVFRDTPPMITGVASNFSERIIIPAGTVIGSYSAPWHGTAHFNTSIDYTGLIWDGADTTATLLAPSLSIPTPATPQTSEVTVTNADVVQQTQLPLTLISAIHRPPFLWRFTHPS